MLIFLCPNCNRKYFQTSTIRSNQKCSKVVGTSSDIFGNIGEVFRKSSEIFGSGWDVFGHPDHDKTKISRI